MSKLTTQDAQFVINQIFNLQTDNGRFVCGSIKGGGLRGPKPRTILFIENDHPFVCDFVASAPSWEEAIAIVLTKFTVSTR